MITIKSTPRQLIESLSKARDEVDQIKEKLDNIQPAPMIGDVWKNLHDDTVIPYDVNGNLVKVIRLCDNQKFEHTFTNFLMKFYRVGTVRDLTFSPGDIGPIEQDKDLPKFRPFDEQDWSMFAGATAFGEGIPPHIMELDWALIIVDKTGIELYPRAELTNGDPECWREDWECDEFENSIPTLDQAIKYGLQTASEIKNMEDLRQQDVLTRIS